MKVCRIIATCITLTAAAQADFSYKTTRKTGGAMAAMASQGPQVSTYYFRGQKMKSDSGTTATVLDFDAQTVTTINNTAKTYTVRNFSDLAGTGSVGVDAKIDVKETGQTKMVNGFMANEIVMTMELESPQTRQIGQMQMEMELWVSADVPGSAQASEFYQRNAGRFPWAAMSNGGNASMQKAMADMQRKMASIHGVQVESVVRMKSAGGGSGMPQMSGAQNDQLAQARARLEAMVAQGGPGAAGAKMALSRMPGGAPAGGSGTGAVVENYADSKRLFHGRHPGFRLRNSRRLSERELTIHGSNSAGRIRFTIASPGCTEVLRPAGLRLSHRRRHRTPGGLPETPAGRI